MLKILHTSDWHLGRSLYGQKRYAEFSQFLDWLYQTIESEKIDVLLIAGDIFDSHLPSNRAQSLYYQFLCRVIPSCCQHVVIIGGNHDSPSFLNAPKTLLSSINVYVIGSVTDDLSDEVIVLKDNQNDAQAIICAVPYLRDKDIRQVEAGENIDDKNKKLVDGLQNHYRQVCEIACQKRSELGQYDSAGIPIIAMGHLFTNGGQTIDGDGVRELYVGSLAHVGRDVFPASIDYLALGHLHVAQKVRGEDCLRYSGSPIAMGFGEAKQQKKVIVVSFDQRTPKVKEMPVPVFQKLERIVGTVDEIKTAIHRLKQENSDAWIEIEYTGLKEVGRLQSDILNELNGSDLKICRIKNKQLMEQALEASQIDESLDDLTPTDVFKRYLDRLDADINRDELIEMYHEIVKSIHEEDSYAE